MQNFKSTLMENALNITEWFKNIEQKRLHNFIIFNIKPINN